MSSEVLTSQVALTDRERCGILTAVEDDIALSVRNVGKMCYLYSCCLQDRLKQALQSIQKKLYREFWLANRLGEMVDERSGDGY